MTLPLRPLPPCRAVPLAGAGADRDGFLPGSAGAAMNRVWGPQPLPRQPQRRRAALFAELQLLGRELAAAGKSSLLPAATRSGPCWNVKLGE